MDVPDTVMEPRVLPEDVIAQILLFCEIGDILSCAQACRSFALVVKTDLYLQYKIELAINGMVDCHDGSSMCIGERLEMLRRYRERSYGGPSAYIDTGDEFLWPPEEDSPDRHDWQDIGANVGVTGGPAYALIKPALGVIDIYATPLFSQVNMRHWSAPIEPQTYEGEVPEVMNACADASQDLLMIFVMCEPYERTSFKIHISLLSEPAQPHPLAAQSDIVVERPVVDARIKDIQIEGHLLGFAFWDRPWCIMVINWHSGATLWSGTNHVRRTFSLLDSSYILMAQPQCELEVEVYRFITDAPNPAAAYAEIEHILTLQFPSPDSVDPDYGPRNMLIKGCSPPLPPPGAPFWPDPDLRIVVMKWYTATFSNEGIMSILPYKDLRRLIDRAQSSRTDSTTEKVLPWEAWSKYSLNLRLVPYLNAISCTFGSRMPLLHVSDEDGDFSVFVVDLNPWAAWHARKEPSEEAARAQWEENQAAFKHFEECFAPDSTNGPPRYSVCRMPRVRHTDSTPHLVMDHNGCTVIFYPPYSKHPGSQSFFVTV